MRTTSSGCWMIWSPCRLNITMMVNSSATRVIGLMRGMNLVSYHSWPFGAQQDEP